MRPSARGRRAELRLLDKLGPAWNLLGVAESLDAHRAAGLTAHELNSVEVLLLHRTVGAPIGGDRGRLQSIIPELPNLKWIHSTFAGVVRALVCTRAHAAPPPSTDAHSSAAAAAAAAASLKRACACARV